MARYDYKHAMDCAHRCIENANRYFKNEQAMNWICGEVYSALMWSIESWILKNGYESKSCYGWNALMGQFSKLAPPSIKGSILYNLSRSVLYDTYNPIEGPIDGGHIDYEDWKSNVAKLLIDSEESIRILEYKNNL